MPNFKNMKIEINEDQPLDEVVKEFERLGYKRNQNFWDGLSNPKIVCSCDDGDLMDMRDESSLRFLGRYDFVTLEELKNMKVSNG